MRVPSILAYGLVTISALAPMLVSPVIVEAATQYPVSAAVGVNETVTPFSGSTYVETAAADDPTNHANIVVGTNQVVSQSTLLTKVAVSRSSDSGTTWSTTNPPYPSNPPNANIVDPSLAFDSSGNLYFSYLGVESVSSKQIVVSKSLDKGATWSSPLTVDANNPDKEMTTIDLTSTPSSHHNRIYVAYDRQINGYSQPIYVAHSDDGTTWSSQNQVQVYNSGGAYFAMPAVGPSGEVYVVSDDFCGGAQSSTGPCTITNGGQIAISKSVNGGADFTSLTPLQNGKTVNERVIASTAIAAPRCIFLSQSRLMGACPGPRRRYR